MSTIPDITRGKQHLDIFKAVGTVPISYGDIERLKPSGWLNDSIIQAFIELLREFTQNHGTPKSFHLFSVYFLPYVKCGEGHKYMRRHNIDFTTLDNLFIPVNCKNLHWVTVLIRKSFKRIEIYDSKHDSKQGLPSVTAVDDLANTELYRDIKVLIDYLIAQFNVHASEWTCLFMDCPQQTNDDDCGVHLCINTLCGALDFEADFDAKKVSTFRRYMVECLSQDVLIPGRV